MEKIKFFFIKLKILNLYSLPTNLKFSKINKNFLKKRNFFKFIFLDKKKKLVNFKVYKSKKIGYPKISEFKNNQKIKKTIENVFIQLKI